MLPIHGTKKVSLDRDTFLKIACHPVVRPCHFIDCQCLSPSTHAKKKDVIPSQIPLIRGDKDIGYVTGNRFMSGSQAIIFLYIDKTRCYSWVK